MKTGDVYVGTSTEDQMLQGGENGGVVTSLLKFALESNLVDTVVAVRKGESRYEAVLSFIRIAEEVRQCAGTLHFATPGIAASVRKYLNSHNERIAVVCKSCDARALIELSKIGQVNLDNIIMIGVNCSGTMAPVPAADMIRAAGIDPPTLIYEDIDDGKVIFKFEGSTEKSFELKELEEKGLGRRNNCRRCEYPVPRMADLACGRWGSDSEKETFVELCSEKGKELFEKAVSEKFIKVRPASAEQIKLRERQEKSQIDMAQQQQAAEFAEREDKFYWLTQMQACIKCYGCRDVCPLCHCRRCVLERDVPETVEKGTIPPPPTFGMIRAFHVAYSCVNCGQCEDVCSADIPLSALTHYLSRSAANLFDYEAGINPGDRLPLSTIPEAEKANVGVDLL